MIDGLKDKHRKAIKNILAANKRVERVVLLGSRAMQTFTPVSDVDLALYGEYLTMTDQAKLAAAIDELSMAQRVDLLLYKSIENEKLQEHIKKHGVEWYRRDGGRRDDWLNCSVEKVAAPIKNALVGDPFGSNLVSKDYVDSGVPVIRGQNMGHGRWVAGDFAFVSLEKANALSANTARPGDLVFTQRGTLGQVAIVPDGPYEKYIISQSQMKLTVDDRKADALFLYYVFRSAEQQNYIKINAIQVGVPHTNLGFLKNTPVRLPSLEMQREIAEILSCLDDKIELNRQFNQTLEEIAQAIFKSWFVDFEPVKAKIKANEEWKIKNGELKGDNPELAKQHAQFINRAAMCAISGKAEAELDQLPPTQLTQLATTAALFPDELVESELGLIPQGWKVNRIENVIKRFPVGKRYAQKTASEKGKIPILDQGKSGIIGYHDDKPGVNSSPDDPIVVFANHTCYMRLVMHDFSAIQNVLPFKGLGLNIYWIYVATYGKQEFVEYKGHWPDFVIKQIVIPGDHLDENFGDHVVGLFKKIFQNETQNLNLGEIRDTLLPKLLSGELPVNQPEK